MPHHLTTIFYRIVFKATYFISLLLGVMPGVYDVQQNNFKASIRYLVYSVFAHSVVLAIIAFTAPFVQHGNQYMSDKPILQFAHEIGVVARSLVVLVISYMIWFRRQNLLEVYDGYRRFLEKYKSFQDTFAIYFANDLHQQELYRQRMIVYKFISLNLNSFLITILFIQLEDRPGHVYYVMLFNNLLQNMFLVICTLQFVIFLSEIQMRFYFINKALEAMQFIPLPAWQSLNHYTLLYEMHVKSFQLSCDGVEPLIIVTFFMLLKIFTSNILLLYHGVLMLLNYLPSSQLSNSMGMLCVLNFYWDCYLIIAIMDGALKACNTTGEFLRGCGWKPCEVRDVGTCKTISQVVSRRSQWQYKYVF